MERLPLRDLRTLLDVLRDVYAIRPPEPFVRHLVKTLPRVIPAELTFYAEGAAGPTGFVPGQMTADDPQYLPEIHLMVVGGRTYKDHPFTRHLVRGWRGEPILLSHFRSRREQHRTALYNEEFKRLGIEYQMSCLFQLPPRIRTLVLNRSGREFTERERLLLDLLRPHVSQARHNADLLGGLEEAFAGATAVLADLNRGVILLTREGRIRWCSPPGGGLPRRLLRRGTRFGDASPRATRSLARVPASRPHAGRRGAVPASPPGLGTGGHRPHHPVPVGDRPALSAPGRATPTTGRGDPRTSGSHAA